MAVEHAQVRALLALWKNPHRSQDCCQRRHFGAYRDGSRGRGRICVAIHPLRARRTPRTVDQLIVGAPAAPTAHSAAVSPVVPMRDAEASTADCTEREGNDMADKQPNIVVFFWDNFGWGELGCYGGGVLRGAPTPRIDKLADQGA